MSSQKSCVALTRRGTRCKNRMKDEHQGFCSVHLKCYPIVQPVHTRAEKVERVVKLAGGISGLIAAIIKIAEFAHAHWDRITMLWHVDTTTVRPAKKVQRTRKLVNGIRTLKPRTGLLDRWAVLLRKERVSEIELQKLAREFDTWFRNLPNHLRKDVTEYFGKEYIRAVRVALANRS